MVFYIVIEIKWELKIENKNSQIIAMYVMKNLEFKF